MRTCNFNKTITLFIHSFAENHLVFLPAWYHPAHPSLRIGHIPLISGNEMHMHMKDRLPGSLIHIDAHIVSIRMIAFINFLLHILEHDIHGLPLMVCQIEIRSHMTLGDNQSMAGRYWITIVKCDTCCCLTYYFDLA